MSEHLQQDCPRCVGALRAARRRIDAALSQAKYAREQMADARSLAATEERRARNGDPMHIHVPGGVAYGDCTLASHAAERDRMLDDAKQAGRYARAWERAAIKEAALIAKAADRLLAGCDLCGRPPMPVKWSTYCVRGNT